MPTRSFLGLYSTAISAEKYRILADGRIKRRKYGYWVSAASLRAGVMRGVIVLVWDGIRETDD